MICQVVRNTDTNEIEKVLAPNGKESTLFKDINKYISSKEEAYKAYAQIYTPSFKEWFGDWESGKEPVVKTKEGVKELFDSNPELVSIGTSEQYSAYLDSIFPDSQVKDIVYHTNTRGRIESFNSERGLFVTPTLELAKTYKPGPNGKRFQLVINSKNINEVSEKTIMDGKKQSGDTLMYSEADYTEYVVFDPEQIHILGNEQDIEKFKNFVEGKQTKETSGVSQVVDENGEPKLVFHWSPEKNIEYFNLAGIGSHFGTYEAADEVNANKSGGTFTLVDKELGTEEIMKYEGEEGKFYPAFLNLRNMAEIEDTGQHTEEKDGAKAKELLEQGYDGFYYTNVYEDKGSTSYVVTEKSQVKSLYNQGTFSSRSGNIYANIAPDLSAPNVVAAGLKSINILQSDKAIEVFAKGEKNKWSFDKILTELQIPKDQANLLKQYNTTDREELITNMLADYSYTIEINTAKSEFEKKIGENEGYAFIHQGSEYNAFFNPGGDIEYEKDGDQISEKEYFKAKKEGEKTTTSVPTQYYSNLTVPGGTNYTENEIATPAITPNIKGHAQFATDKGIGWFRSDDKTGLENNLISDLPNVFQVDFPVGKFEYRKENNNWNLYKLEKNKFVLFNKNEPIEEVKESYNKSYNAKNIITTKTRRILEVQSDLFQKGRDKQSLTGNFSKVSNNPRIFTLNDILYNGSGKTAFKLDTNTGIEKNITEQEFLEAKQKHDKLAFGKENQFLQLLNKDNNWVTFFVKSIIQDSAKKGYEKVLFPSGDTASKVEGHTSLEEFKKEKTNRLNKLSETTDSLNKLVIKETGYGSFIIRDKEGFTPEARFRLNDIFDSKKIAKEKIKAELKDIENEANQIKQELERVETEGFAALKPIYNFYENTLANILKKQGYNPKQITDEYGNTWNEVDIKEEYKDKVLFNIEANGQLNDPVTASAIKELQDKGILSATSDRGNNFYIAKPGSATTRVEDLASQIKEVESLLESKNIEYKRIGDSIKIYGLPQYKYSYNFTQLDTQEDEINNIKDLKKELGITGKSLSYSEYNDIARSLKSYNEQNDTNYLLVADQQTDGSIVVKTIVEDKTRNKSILSVTQELMDRLQALFPEVKVQYINENEISKYSNGRFSNSDVTINSFVKDGVAYLVRDRFTGDIAVEEFLHPFVSAIEFDNPKLADSLYAEILDRFPDIANLVEKTYTDARGFTEADRKNEIITKGLQRAFSEKLQDSFKGKDKAVKGLLEQVLDWVRDLIRKITGRKKLYTGELSTQMKVDDIINMLDSNIQIKLGIIDQAAYPNLSQEKIDILNYLLKNASAEQKEIVEALFDNGIVHNEVEHTYEKVIVDADGEVEDIIEYTSMTTAIKGPFEDTAYELNRDIGTEFDFIMNSVVMGEDFDAIKLQLKVVNEATAAKFYDMITNVIVGLKSSGAIVVPQVVLGSDADAIAGKLDLLIIEPSGKMRIIDLKTSATNDVKNNPKKYNTKYEIENEESMLNGERLSNRDLHGIQQQGYKRMIELDSRLTDYEVESVKTLHYRFEINDGMAVDIKYDDLVDHTDSHYDDLLNKIIASQPLERTSGFSSNLSEEQAKPENKETVDQIRDLVKDALGMLQKRKEFYEKINETSKGKFIVTKEYLSSLDDIIADLNEAILTGKPANAYYRLVKHINQDVRDKARTLGKMTDRSENIQFMLEAEKDLETYKQLLLPPKLYLNNKTIDKLAKESLNVIDQTLNLIETEVAAFTVDFIANNTNRDLTREEVEGIIKEAEDISLHAYQFGDLSTSSDLMLSVLDKVYKRKRQEIVDFVQNLEIEIKTAGNKLAALSPDKNKMYDFMIGTDDKGNLTGYTIDKIGKQYWSLRRSIKEKLIDPETGLRYKYREIRNPKSASKEDIEFNLNLKKLREEEAKFNQKEYLNEDGKLVDGKYHKYTDEFKEARAKVMRLKIRKNADGDAVGFEWIPKNADSKEFKDFEKKFYGTETTYLSPKYDYDKASKTYIFKGRTEETSGRFVKSEYVEIREIAEGGEDMRDEKYVSIMTDNSELGIARREYYETWKRLYAELLEKLPDGVKMRTKLPVIKSGMVAQAKKMGGGTNYFKGILKGVGKSINPFPKSTFHHSVLLDENGNVVSNIPVFYTGDLKSEYAIEKIKEKLKDLNERWAKKTPDDEGNILTYEEYRKKLDKLTKSLRIEQNKTSASELSTEMTNNLVQFADMAENFQVMSEFESTVISVLRSLKNRKVLKRDPDGNIITNSLDKMSAKFKGDDSLTEKRLRKWMDMVLYNSKNPYRSRMGNFVKKVKLLMSIKGVGLNPFGQINNLKMGNINNMVEAAAGTIFNKSDYKKAIKAFTTDYLPAFLSAKKDYIFSKGKDKNGDYYKLPKSLTKYDALANKYRMMRAMQSKDGIEGYEGKAMDLAFMIQHGAEFSIQTKSGMAILNNRTFTNKITGEKVSIYDAHSFDQKTGEVFLDPALYEETDEERYDMTNLIYETNKRLHGNYAWEDRMVIQESLIGEMLAQFHKWVYPFVRRFWGKQYHDENLGETEGIFISMYKLGRAVYDMTKLDGGLWKGAIPSKQSFTDAWATMSDYQKSNITRLLGYMGFYLLSLILKKIWAIIAEDLADDDTGEDHPVLTKLVNFLVYQNDRTMSEISVAIDPTQIGQFVKNPIAIVGFIGDAWDAISETGKFIMPPYGQEDEVFQRGVNKGEYKWQKEWGDILPFFSAINKWDSFEELKSFYIK